jgi:hypothetical protein
MFPTQAVNTLFKESTQPQQSHPPDIGERRAPHCQDRRATVSIVGPTPFLGNGSGAPKDPSRKKSATSVPPVSARGARSWLPIGHNKTLSIDMKNKQVDREDYICEMSGRNNVTSQKENAVEATQTSILGHVRY